MPKERKGLVQKPVVKICPFMSIRAVVASQGDADFVNCLEDECALWAAESCGLIYREPRISVEAAEIER